MQNDTLCLTSKFSFYLDIDLFINIPTFLSITYFSVIRRFDRKIPDSK